MNPNPFGSTPFVVLQSFLNILPKLYQDFCTIVTLWSRILNTFNQKIKKQLNPREKKLHLAILTYIFDERKKTFIKNVVLDSVFGTISNLIKLFSVSCISVMAVRTESAERDVNVVLILPLPLPMY